jgi:tRNA threonylcarbamoyladenosine biosynthesis protein TsaE
MEKGIFLSKNASQTQKLAGKIAADLVIARGRKNAMVLALEGELGGGKTTFVQGLAKALGVKEKITSPTFVILKRFKIHDLSPSTSLRVKFKNFYHIDCYRLNKPEELVELDFKKIIERPENLVVIEWAEKVKSLIPKEAVWVGFEWLSENERKIIIKTS